MMNSYMVEIPSYGYSYRTNNFREALKFANGKRQQHSQVLIFKLSGVKNCYDTEACEFFDEGTCVRAYEWHASRYR